MRALLRIGAAALAAVVLLAAITVASLVGLEAECTGADCPRSEAFRVTEWASPLLAAVVLLAGAGWSCYLRRLWPLVLAEAVVLAGWAVAGAVLGDIGLVTVGLLSGAVLLARAALRRSATS